MRIPDWSTGPKGRRSLRHGVAALAVLILTACGNDFHFATCDDPLAALIVRTVDGNGVRIRPDKVEAFQEDELVDVLQCTVGECATWNLVTGTYRVAGSWRGQLLDQVVDVENSFACDHHVAQIEFAFDAVS